MVLRRVAVVAVLAAALAGCGTTTNQPSPSPSPGLPTRGVTTAPYNTPQNLAVTDDLRATLLAVGAKARGLTPSDFLGLRAGLTYYAYDPTTQTYWAGASLNPSPNSERALVSSQDDGGYTLFEKVGSGAWTSKEAGMAGLHGGGPCPLPLPAAVVQLWGWPAGACHPERL